MDISEKTLAIQLHLHSFLLRFSERVSEEVHGIAEQIATKEERFCNEIATTDCYPCL